MIEQVRANMALAAEEEVTSVEAEEEREEATSVKAEEVVTIVIVKETKIRNKGPTRQQHTDKHDFI